MSDEKKQSIVAILARLEKLEKSQEETNTLVREVHGFLVGRDKLRNGKPGLVDVVDQHGKDMYGDKPTGHEGVKPKVERLEDGYKKWVGIIVGIHGTAGIVVLVLLNWDAIKSLFK